MSQTNENGVDTPAVSRKRKRRRSRRTIELLDEIAVLQKSMEAVFPVIAQRVYTARAEVKRLESIAKLLGVDVSLHDPSAEASAQTAAAADVPAQLAKLPMTFSRDDMKRLRIMHHRIPQWVRKGVIRKVGAGQYQRLV